MKPSETTILIESTGHGIGVITQFGSKIKGFKIGQEVKFDQDRLMDFMYNDKHIYIAKVSDLELKK